MSTVGGFLAARRTQLVQTNISAAGLALGQQRFFDTQPQLQSQIDQIVLIEALEVYGIDTLAAGPDGVQAMSVADLTNLVLVLNVAGTDTFKNLPVLRLRTVGSNASPVAQQPFYLDYIDKVDWTKSYIQAVGAVTASRAFLLNVTYRYIPPTVS